MKNLKSNFLTEEIRWLICFLRKQLALEVYKRRIKSPEDEYKDKNKKLYSDEDDEEDYDQIAEAELNNYKESDDIQKQMLKLVFSPIIKEVQRCVTYKDFSKILGRDEDMKPLEENHSYQTFITKYCKLLQAALFRDLSMIEDEHKSRLESYKQSGENIFKCFGINLDIFDLDLEILRETLSESMKMKPVILNISVGDLITIQNELIDLRDSEMHQDPMFRLIEGWKKVEAKSAISDKKQRINLYLKTHILEDKNKLIKCEFCDGPITSSMIPEEEFNMIFNYREEESKEEKLDDGSELNINDYQLLKRYQSKIELGIERYFTQFLEEFNLIQYDSSVEKFIERQDELLKDKLEDPEKFNKLQIVNNLSKEHELYSKQYNEGDKSNRENKDSDYNKPKHSILAILEKHQREDNHTEFSSISVYNFLRERKINKKKRRRLTLYECLNELCKHNLRNREKHKMYQDKVREMLMKMEEQIDSLEFKTQHYMSQLSKIRHCTNKGNMKTDSLKEALLARDNAADDKKVNKRANNPLEVFMKQFDKDVVGKDKKRDELKRLDEQRNILIGGNREMGSGGYFEHTGSGNCEVYAKYPLYILKQMRVLVDIKLKEQKFDKLFKKSSLIFVGDGDNGFKVNLIYVEKSNGTILTTFPIKTQDLLSIRRRKSSKATVSFGEATFNIYELVNFLNKLYSNTVMP